MNAGPSAELEPNTVAALHARGPWSGMRIVYHLMAPETIHVVV